MFVVEFLFCLALARICTDKCDVWPTDVHVYAEETPNPLMSADLISLRPLEHSSSPNLWDWWMLWGSDQWPPSTCPCPLHGRELLSDFTCRGGTNSIINKGRDVEYQGWCAGRGRDTAALGFHQLGQNPRHSEVCSDKTWGAEDGEARIETTPGLQDILLWKAKLNHV